MDKTTLFPVKDLHTTFKERETAFSNRASCLFPAYLGRDQDTHLVFLNYWTIKNRIETHNLIFNIRVRDSLGKLLVLATIDQIKPHNQISVKKFLANANYNVDFEFRGVVELEIISTKNLRYSFPAVIVVYQAKELFSAVHSAGRIKNSDELHTIGFSHETNWNCKFGINVTPFFHYFVGPSLPSHRQIEVTLRDAAGHVVQTRMIDIGHLRPFGSETYFVDSLFECDGFDSSYFVSAKVEHNSVYPRLVVGNYFKAEGFFEITHSYPIVETPDYCPFSSDVTYQSTICAFTSEELGLSLRSFPTFSRPKMRWDTYVQKYGQSQLQQSSAHGTTKITEFMAGREIYTLGGQEYFLAFCLKGDKVPTRMTVSYQFFVKGVRSPYSTDISDGAKACIFPPKYSYWGHGLLSGDFDTCIFLRNKSHSPEKTKASKGRLRVFFNNIEEVFDIEIAPETLKLIKLRDLLVEVDLSETNSPQFASWILVMDEPTCDTFWVAYSLKSGNVFGDHGF
jgi:hypothetical protein